jgi:Domain of unknown function (DUF5605)/Domain of unknown function (DUF5060)/Protein of unknown function (DUF4038)
MIVTRKTRLGRILRNPKAKSSLFAAAPELNGAAHLDVVKGFSLERLAEMTNRDQRWIDAIVSELGDVTDERPNQEQIDEAPPAPVDDGPAASASLDLRPSCPLWGVEELTLRGPADQNPFLDVELRARFSCGNRTVTCLGFYDGDGIYRIRCMPDAEGIWAFRTESNARSLDGIEGSFECGPALPGRHGPVRVADTFHFAHADGTRYRPIGTTCYAWTHQDETLERQTLKTLEASPFNKVRMCVFPKSYLYNENEPARHAFEQLADGSFDLTRFNPAFFRHLDERVADLGRLGIEADLILFHPYDRWGYSEMPRRADDRYLRYVIARVGAYCNVWWSLANEYDLLWDKEDEDWERFGALVHDHDPYGHLIGVHQCFDFYDHAKPWVTHCSLQRVDNYRTAENTSEWRERWTKPIVIDECAYEGDIDMTWGNISGEEMTRRCWEGAVRGGYVGHGETYNDPDQILWWSKGGRLRGSSVARIAFLRSVLEQGPERLEPVLEMSRHGYPTVGQSGAYYLQYLGSFQPRWRTMEVPTDETYRAEVIDTWNMTVTDAGVHNGTFRIELPGRPYMAIRLGRVD